MTESSLRFNLMFTFTERIYMRFKMWKLKLLNLLNLDWLRWLMSCISALSFAQIFLLNLKLWLQSWLISPSNNQFWSCSVVVIDRVDIVNLIWRTMLPELRNNDAYSRSVRNCNIRVLSCFRSWIIFRIQWSSSRVTCCIWMVCLKQRQSAFTVLPHLDAIALNQFRVTVFLQSSEVNHKPKHD